MVRDVIGGVTRSKLADRADPDEGFIQEKKIDSACESRHVVHWYPDEKKPK